MFPQFGWLCRSPACDSAGALIPPEVLSEGDAGVQAYIAAWSRGRPPSPSTSTRWSVSFSAGVEKLRRLNESFEGILEETERFGRRT